MVVGIIHETFLHSVHLSTTFVAPITISCAPPPPYSYTKHALHGEQVSKTLVFPNAITRQVCGGNPLSYFPTEPHLHSAYHLFFLLPERGELVVEVLYAPFSTEYVAR